jgi:hypothetical protein
MSIPATNTKFTSLKFNWLDCILNDDRLKPAAFKVAYAILQTVNSVTLVGWLSDETLVDVTGISRAEVQRHRKSLKACGWLTWKRTKTANLYQPLFDQLPDGLEFMLEKRARRKELREARSAARNASLRLETPVTQEASPARHQEASPARHIHLRSNTFGLTPTNTSPSLRSGDASAEEAAASRTLKVDDHQPKAPYLQSDEAAKREFQKLEELPFNTDWTGGLNEWGADFKPLSNSSDRAVKIYWPRLLRAPYSAADVVMVAERVLQRTTRHQRPSLAGFLARFEDYRNKTAPPRLDNLRGPRPQHHTHA